jgi:uncharacterized membrane protein
MDYMELQFPEDMRDARVHAGQNISEVERWASIAGGLGLAAYGLSQRKGRGWALVVLGALLFRRGYTGHCMTYQLLGINTSDTAGDTRLALGGRSGIHVDESVVINRPVEVLYRFWRNLQHLPQVMSHLESVERVTDTLSRWRAKGPGGTTLEWNAEIINDIPDSLIAWRSIEGSDVVSAGSVHFDPTVAGVGTRVRVRLQYSPPGGKVGAFVAKLLGADPAKEIRDDLQRFKQLVEADEFARPQ